MASSDTGLTTRLSNPRHDFTKQSDTFSTPPPGHSASGGGETSTNRQLSVTQLVFEPKPPAEEKKRCSIHSPSPRVRRRAQSAKAPTSHQEKAHDTRPAAPSLGAERRPVSAVMPGEKWSGHTSRQDCAVHAAKAHYAPVPKQFLEFGNGSTEKQISRSRTQKKSKRIDSSRPLSCLSNKNHGNCVIDDEHPTGVQENGIAGSLPKGISALAPWMTPNVPMEWIGVDPATCLVFLPSLLNETEVLPTVPPPQAPQEVLPHKPAAARPKPFNPKKLFHYDVEKNLPSHMKTPGAPHPRSRQGTSRRERIYSLDGQLLHDQIKYSKNRTVHMIEQEMKDLECLLEGVGREGSANVVVQYQYEINMLKRAVTDTIIKCQMLRRPKPKEEEPVDLTGLREFIRERERVLAQIASRRAACLAELQELEVSVGLPPSLGPECGRVPVVATIQELQK